jgi:hypothetical protein
MVPGSSTSFSPSRNCGIGVALLGKRAFEPALITTRGSGGYDRSEHGDDGPYRIVIGKGLLVGQGLHELALRGAC